LDSGLRQNDEKSGGRQKDAFRFRETTPGWREAAQQLQTIVILDLIQDRIQDPF
jgi:hypothetical protein